jgi:uncharacterized protein YecA (UPF0149 family)
MNITSPQQAFQILDDCYDQIPYEAIQCLYEAPDSAELHRKIADTFNHRDAEPALWYAIVAENHLSESLIDPLIQLLVHHDRDMEYLTLEIQYLVGALARKFPEKMPQTVLAVLEQEMHNGTINFLDPLLETFFHVKVEPFKSRLLAVAAHENNCYQTQFADLFSRIGMQEAMPLLKTWYQNFKRQFELSDSPIFYASQEAIADAVHRLKKSRKFGDADSFYLSRGSCWKTFLKNVEEQYDQMDEEMERFSETIKNMAEQMFKDNNPMYSMDSPLQSPKENAQNEQCPCGSGKNYKKCCGR